MEEILPVLMPATEKIGSFAEILQGVSAALAGLQGNVNAILGSAAKGISEATQVIVGGFSQVRSSIAPFVAALNPSIVFGLDQTFKSLQATIGVALVPVAQVLTTTLREVAGELMVSMEELAPVLETIAQAVENLVLPPFMLLAEGIKAFAPVLSFLASGVKIVTNALAGLAVVGRSMFQTIGAWLSGLFGSGTKDALAGFPRLCNRWFAL